MFGKTNNCQLSIWSRLIKVLQVIFYTLKTDREDGQKLGPYSILNEHAEDFIHKLKRCLQIPREGATF